MTVKFHTDGFDRPKAAVNVKVLTDFHLTDRLQPYYERLGYDSQQFDALVQVQLESIEEDWWNYEVQDVARENGFTKVFSEGRQSGWAVPYPYIYAEDLDIYPELLDRYVALAEYCKATVDSIDATLYEVMKDLWYVVEESFLRRHSLAVRILERGRNEFADDDAVRERDLDDGAVSGAFE